MLDRVEEHHELHRRVADRIVVLERLLYNLGEVRQVRHALVDARVGARHEVVPIDEPPRPSHLGPPKVEVLLQLHLHQVSEPVAVFVVDEAVGEDAVVLVDPEREKFRLVLADELRVGAEQALEDASEIAEVEGVVALGRGWEQVRAHNVVHLHRGGGDGADNAREIGRELLRNRRVQNCGEDELRGLVRHVGKPEEVEVAQKAVGDRVAAAPGRAHATDELDVHNLAEGARRTPLVPTLVVHPLTQQLDRRLRKVFLTHRHIHIVDEHDILFAGRRTEDALAALVHLAIDEVLRLVGGGARGKGDKDGHDLLRHPVLELVHDVERLARAGVADTEHVLAVREQAVDQEGVADSVGGGDDDGAKVLVGVRLVRRDGGHPPAPLELVLHVAVLVHRLL
mmetsp:Transcript_23989/g.77974  ORF Transcript_23989/g.77974 Transcript_23989/m.77974 type:complete len:397 (-) Transcript_23989:780-1970(-)